MALDFRLHLLSPLMVSALLPAQPEGRGTLWKQQSSGRGLSYNSPVTCSVFCSCCHLFFEVLLSLRKDLRSFFPSSKWVFSLLLLSEVRPEIISAPEGTSCPQESWQFTHFLTVGGDAAFIMRGIQKGQDVFVTSFHSFPHNPIWILSMSPSSLVFFTFPNNLAITIIVKA